MVAPRNLDDVLRREVPLVRKGKTVESVLVDLRGEGFSVIDCMRVVMIIDSCELPEAKRIVHESAAWSDLREAHEAAHEELARRASEETD